MQKREGTQTIGRAVLILRELATRGHFGWRLGDLADRCGLDKGTTHRILSRLKTERLVHQNASDRRYLPGPLIYELALSLPDYAGLCRYSEVHLAGVAKRYGAVAFLCLRSGAEFVCAARIGSLRSSAMMMDVGTRRALVSSASGIAMLLKLPADEARSLIVQNNLALANGTTAASRQTNRIWRRSAKAGYGVNEQDSLPGWNAYAVAVLDPQQKPFAAIMLVGKAATFSVKRYPELTRVLREASAAFAQEAEKSLFSRYGTQEPKDDLAGKLKTFANRRVASRTVARER